MKRLEYILMTAALAALAACSADETIHGDDNAVKLCATVGEPALALKSNPAATGDQQVAFGTGDRISVSDGSQTAVYALSSSDEWTTTDAPVVWTIEGGTFKAFYPADGTNTFDLGAIRKDQSTTENLSASDYMRQTYTYTSVPADHTLSLALQRQTARVIFKISYSGQLTGVKNQYDGLNPSIDYLHVCSPTEIPATASSALSEITTYKSGDDFVALVVPTSAKSNEKFVRLRVKYDGNSDGTELTVTGIPAMEAGGSYTYTLTVGKDVASVGGVSVAGWATGSALPNSTMTYNEARSVKQSIAAQLAAGKTAIAVTLSSDASSEVFTAITDAITAGGVADQSIDLTINGAKFIPDNAFSGFGKLKSLTAPQVQVVGSRAFTNCNVKTLILSSVTHMGSFVFKEMDQLTSLTLGPVESIDSGPFDDTPTSNIALTFSSSQKQLIYDAESQMYTAGSTFYSATDDWGNKKFAGQTFGSVTIDGCVLVGGHPFVDLGLPSGLLWATMNVGASAPADAGGYYSWGETETKTNYNSTTYTHRNIYTDVLNKYNSSDNKTVLEAGDDVAYQKWGSSCRMPTSAEFEELLNTDNCTWTWTSMLNSSNKSVNGYKVVSKKNGYSMFLPAVGNYDALGFQNSNNYYWSGSIYAGNVNYAGCLKISSTELRSAYVVRLVGCPVRPVAAP